MINRQLTQTCAENAPASETTASDGGLWNTPQSRKAKLRLNLKVLREMGVGTK